MAALDFPASPTVGSTYSPASGVTYTWSGTMWLVSGASAGGDFYATQNTSIPNVGPTFTTMKPPLVTGTGGFYNVTNGRYTPPAGRYHIQADASGNTGVATTNHLGVQIRKNGAIVQDNYDGTGSSWYGFTTISVILDANGSDWFDAQYMCSETTAVLDSISFLAFPISGIKGPPGDPYPGTVGGDFCANQTSSFPAMGTTTVQLILNQISSGNSPPASYNTTTGRYTPPAGRYYIAASFSCTSSAAAAHMILELHRNGSTVVSGWDTTNSATWYANPSVSGVFDCSGTDYFEIWGQNSAGGTASFTGITFLAYPISGIKGPTGDPGAPGITSDIPQNAQTGTYTLVASDAGKHIYNAAGGAAYTIPDNGALPFPIGTAVTFVNDSATPITIVVNTNTLVLSPGGATGVRTLSQYGMATALKVTATRWIISGTSLT